MTPPTPSADFNPYHKWLGISGATKTPDHYRLLGIESFESDADVIASAADRQMAHLRKYQSGPHAALSQQLLNEIATAKVCLLNNEKKQTYDAALQGDEEQTHPVASPAVPSPTIQVRTDDSTRRVRAKKSSYRAIVLLCTVAILAGAFGIGWHFTNKDPIDTTDDITNLKPVVEASGATNREVSDSDHRQEPQASALADSSTDNSAEKTTVRNRPRPMSPAEYAQKSGTESGELPNRNTGEKPRAGIVPSTAATVEEFHLPSNVASATTQTRNEELPKRSAIPSRAELATGKKRLGELMKKAGRTRPATAAAIIPFLDHEDVNDDKCLRYATLQLILDTAIRNGNVDVALETAKRLVANFSVDKHAVQSETLSELIRSVRKDPIGRARLLSAMHTEMWNSLRISDYPSANLLAAKILVAAKNSRDKETIKWARGLPDILKQKQVQFDELATAKSTIEKDPDHPESNHAVGRYLCFCVNDFENGIALLAKGPDGLLRSLARQELSRQPPPQRLKLADKWWNYAASQSPETSRHIRSHAVQHYSKIVTKLPLAERALLLERIAENEFKSSLFRRPSLVVGSVWNITWEQHSNWDELEFLRDGKCRVRTLGNDLFYTWRLEPQQVLLQSLDGLRLYRLTPISDIVLHCEHIGRKDNRLISLGTGTRTKPPASL